MAKHAKSGKGGEVTVTLKSQEEARVILPAAADSGWQLMPRDQAAAARRLEQLEAAKDLAAEASPGLVRMLIALAHDPAVAKRERIQAAGLVFRVGGIEETPAAGTPDKEISEMTPDELRLFVLRGRARLEAIEAASDVALDEEGEPRGGTRH
ncbi:MAG: hypothetical protein ACOZDY_11005 [Pseudomonadota bacterium]